MHHTTALQRSEASRLANPCPIQVADLNQNVAGEALASAVRRVRLTDGRSSSVLVELFEGCSEQNTRVSWDVLVVVRCTRMPCLLMVSRSLSIVFSHWWEIAFPRHKMANYTEWMCSQAFYAINYTIRVRELSPDDDVPIRTLLVKDVRLWCLSPLFSYFPSHL